MVTNVKQHELTVDDYAQAVIELVTLARSDTGGSRVAAQVLLSTYNGEEWQLNLTDLCVLDQDYYDAALCVIHGRVDFMIEPHTLIEKGDEIFKALWEQWQRYHVSNRWKPTCTVCAGSGGIMEKDDDGNYESWVACSRCNGLGVYAKICD